VPNCTTYSNATAGARRRARREHAGTGSNIYLSKYSTAKHAVLCVLVRKEEDRRDGASNVLAIAGAVKGKAVERIVYCRSKAQCEAIAKALGCGHYHAGVVDRAERLEAWLKEGELH
jgi:superfamily II DNA helicase RecQ